MLSVNQTAAQIKLIEMWKCRNKQDYPLHRPKMERSENGTTTRSVTSEKFKINNTPKSFIGDATRLWNVAPNDITSAMSLKVAKKCVKNFCKTLLI